MRRRIVFLSGGTGYLGRPLTERLVRDGAAVKVLHRKSSAGNVAVGAEPIEGNPLDANSFSASVQGCDTFVHLTGVAHPAPWKEREFREIDLASLKASAAAACGAGVEHFIYVSVAHPAPVMKGYIRVRQECESILMGMNIPLTILRPWYILGPGHWWPIVLRPAYALAERLPWTRESARRLGLVTRNQMIGALAWSVAQGGSGNRVLGVPEIRETGDRYGA